MSILAGNEDGPSGRYPRQDTTTRSHGRVPQTPGGPGGEGSRRRGGPPVPRHHTLLDPGPTRDSGGLDVRRRLGTWLKGALPPALLRVRPYTRGPPAPPGTPPRTGPLRPEGTVLSVFSVSGKPTFTLVPLCPVKVRHQFPLLTRLSQTLAPWVHTGELNLHRPRPTTSEVYLPCDRPCEPQVKL